jgi:hypothetical protein
LICPLAKWLELSLHPWMAEKLDKYWARIAVSLTEPRAAAGQGKGEIP